MLAQELQEGLMWVAEQIPGLTAAADMTATLERGYWPSYNVPFFREVGIPVPSPKRYVQRLQSEPCRSSITS